MRTLSWDKKEVGQKTTRNLKVAPQLMGFSRE
jgi:hypothetical protein